MKKICLMVMLGIVSQAAWAQKAPDVRREFYEGGALLSETNCAGSSQDGYYREYYENGQLKKEVRYQDGKPEGDFAEYCEDGTLKVMFHYKDSKRDGYYKLYYNNGNLEAEGNFIDGKEDGLHKVYYASGHLASEARYVDGKEQGAIKTYYQDGSLWEEIAFVGGKRDGTYREYDQKGHLKREILYKNGRFANGRHYQADGNVFLTIEEQDVLNQGRELAEETDLRQCASESLGMRFLCHPAWKLERAGLFLTITISEDPKVIMQIAENDIHIRFLSDLSRPALESLGRYAPGYDVSRQRHCGREAVKVKAYLKSDPNVRLTDYYLMDHLTLHRIWFSVDPKSAWEQYQFLIKRVADSFVLTGEKKQDVKLVEEGETSNCEELIEE